MIPTSDEEEMKFDGEHQRSDEEQEHLETAKQMTLTEMSDFLTSQESAFSKQITEAQESFNNLNGMLKDLPKKQAEKIKEEQ